MVLNQPKRFKKLFQKRSCHCRCSNVSVFRMQVRQLLYDVALTYGIKALSGILRTRSGNQMRDGKFIKKTVKGGPKGTIF